MDEEDAFRLTGSQQMESSVDNLASQYESVRNKAQKKIEEQRQKGMDVKNSQSSLLLRALLKDQRKMLVLTGVLRLVNTGIQAFPAILVSRLLRSIEAANSLPVSQALRYAVMLASVLTLKIFTSHQSRDIYTLVLFRAS